MIFNIVVKVVDAISLLLIHALERFGESLDPNDLGGEE